MKIFTFRSFGRTRNLVIAMVLAVVAAQGIVSPIHASDEQSFVSKKYDIKGGWQIVEENGRTLVRFNQGFKTKGGPDLKVFLSPLSIDEVSGKTATEGSLQLGTLQSTDGTQDYVLPEGISLADFQSILVHCEQYSVLWGGGDLTAASN